MKSGSVSIHVFPDVDVVSLNRPDTMQFSDRAIEFSPVAKLNIPSVRVETPIENDELPFATAFVPAASDCDPVAFVDCPIAKDRGPDAMLK